MNDHSEPTVYRDAVLAGICAAAVLLVATLYRLERPGLFYDEVHQATGVFAYIGRPTTMFSVLPIRGVPLMNMPYTGAIKTAVYGTYLRISGRGFSIWSWRLLGVAFSAGGLLAFALLAGRRMSFAALALFFALLVCDTNFLLQTRHDWGPAALGFFLRMILIAIWLRRETGQPRPAGSFVLGLIVGVAIFEKLTSLVLVGPLAMMLLVDRRTRSMRDAASAAAGLLIGALPVIAANLYWLATERTLLVASSYDTVAGRSIVGYVANYLALGNGGIERRMIFDAGASRWSEWVEACAIAGLLLIAGVRGWTRRRSDPEAHLAGVALVCFAAVAAALRVLPHRTAEQHWIVGTPFQYAAIALAAASIWSERARSTRVRTLFAMGLTVLFLARIPAVVSAYGAIRGDRYSLMWDPSLNTAAAYVARQPERTVFIAANWGTAAQVFCVANGRQDFVFDPYNDFRGHPTVDAILNGRRMAVVAVVRPPAPIEPGKESPPWQVTRDILDKLASTPNWEEVPVDASVRNLRAVELHMFRRIN
jgi:hypothetical protein